MKINRRHFLKAMPATALTLQSAGLFQLLLGGSKVWAAPNLNIKNKKKLVFIFMRGGCDTLSMIQPLMDGNYSKENRPNILIPKEQSIKLGSEFGMHPAMTSLKEFWDRGHFNFIHQTGMPITTRSHFDAQDFLENGTLNDKSIEEGFFTRALGQMALDGKEPLKAVALQSNLPRSLYGETKALATGDLDSFKIKNLDLRGHTGDGFESFFESTMKQTLNGQAVEDESHSKTSTLSLIDLIKKVNETKLKQDFSGKGDLAKKLKDIAKLILSDFPAPLYVTEMGGLDTHVNQGNEAGQLAKKLKELSDAMSTLALELGPKLEDTTIIAVTEFGRTLKENGNRGTDHGHGCCYLVMNGHLKPRNIITQWKELKKANLYEERDVPITTDARLIFSEILSTQFKVQNLTEVFPQFKYDRKLNLYI
jgi:uncharacterized protein (DUF1501 family)